MRDKVALQSVAVARLGKDVVDLLDVSVAFPDGEGGQRTILRDIEWRIAPGERTGILGVNGAGKSTLLGLVAGTVAPTTGRVKRGKTVKIAVLDQRLAELDDIANDRVVGCRGPPEGELRGRRGRRAHARPAARTARASRARSCRRR